MYLKVSLQAYIRYMKTALACEVFYFFERIYF